MQTQALPKTGITAYDCTRLDFITNNANSDSGTLVNNQSGASCAYTKTALQYSSAYESIAENCPQSGCPFNVIAAEFEAKNIPSGCDETINNYLFVIVDKENAVYGCYGVPGA